MDPAAFAPAFAELAQRLQQQELLADFGLFALRGQTLQPVLEEACRVASKGLACQFSKILQFQPAEGDFLVLAGLGWRPGIVGHARLGADLASPAGYAFRTGKPVVSNHLDVDDRFRTPDILVEHHIQRAINVLIGGGDTPSFGVLEVDSGERSDFEIRDTAFLQGLANIVAAAVEKTERQEALQRSEAMTRQLFESSPDCVKVLDPDGYLQRMNFNGLCLLEIDDFGAIAGQPWEMLWPADERGQIRAIVQAARDGRTGRFEAFGPTAKGAPKWWDVTVGPVMSESGHVESLVSVSRDITQRRHDIAVKDQLLKQKDLLMQEVHHRVRNSLQLVRTLLQLQVLTITDPSAREALEEAGQRVMTVAAVHKQLYVGQSVHEVELQPYLQGLLADLSISLTDQAKGRRITWTAEPMHLPPDCLTSLGLIVAELVTNALKYGAGQVTVSVQLVDAAVRIMVEDEGPGFPATFDPARSQGLGMRLVTSMAQGADGVYVDRTGSTSRIVVDLPLL
jgi:PAS domain S-box-containing protein